MTDLVTLRPVEPADGAHQARWFADPDVTRYLTLRYPTSLAAAEQRVAAAAAPAFGTWRFTVVATATGEPVGLSVLRDATPENRDAELVLAIGERAAWGAGYGTAATRATCRYAFARLGLHRVHLWVFADHAAAIRVYERVGFAREGMARHRYFKHGRWHDALLMGLLDGELR